MALEPKIFANVAHFLTSSISTKKYRPPSIMQSRPAMYKTKELVHKFLLIGKNQCHPLAMANEIKPAKNNQIILRSAVCLLNKKCPVSIPMMPVTTAVKVLNTPSGSQVPWYIFPGSRKLSTQAARFFPGSSIAYP